MNRQLKKLPILLVISLIFSNLEVSNFKIHIMITESKVTEIFCIADDFCKEFEVEMAKNALPSTKELHTHRQTLLAILSEMPEIL